MTYEDEMLDYEDDLMKTRRVAEESVLAVLIHITRRFLHYIRW